MLWSTVRADGSSVSWQNCVDIGSSSAAAHRAVFDPDMRAMFATITKAGQWKWELDVAAQRNPGQMGAQDIAAVGEREGAQIMPMPEDDPFLDNRQTGADATVFEVSFQLHSLARHQADSIVRALR